MLFQTFGKRFRVATKENCTFSWLHWEHSLVISEVTTMFYMISVDCEQTAWIRKDEFGDAFPHLPKSICQVNLHSGKRKCHFYIFHWFSQFFECAESGNSHVWRDRPCVANRNNKWQPITKTSQWKHCNDSILLANIAFTDEKQIITKLPVLKQKILHSKMYYFFVKPSVILLVRCIYMPLKDGSMLWLCELSPPGISQISVVINNAVTNWHICLLAYVKEHYQHFKHIFCTGLDIWTF